jgi:hypothetical protein
VFCVGGAELYITLAKHLKYVPIIFITITTATIIIITDTITPARTEIV